MPLLFSYGTLQQEAIQRSTFGRALDGAPDELAWFESQALGPHRNAAYTGKSESRVTGTALDVTPEELAKADEYERSTNYVRISVRLASGKDAWMYVSEPHLRGARRSRFIEHVGVVIHESAAGASLASLQVMAHHFNTVGVVHGGAIFTLADTGMAAALIPQLKEGEGCATTSLTIGYFRPVLAGPVVCTSRVVYRGKSLAHVEGNMHVADKLVARANGSWAVFPRRT
jgi:acyl-CoA thioesterase